jgi:hypothetical protein
MAHIRHSRPCSGLEFQVKFLESCHDFPSSLGAAKELANQVPMSPDFELSVDDLGLRISGS